MLVLTVSLLVGAMVVPVSAAENSVGFLDLMAYGGVIYDGVLYPNFQFVPNSDGWGYFEFPVSNRFSLGKAEFLIFSDASTLDIAGVQNAAYFTESTSILPDAKNRYRNYVGTFGGAWQTTENIRVWFYYSGKANNSAIKICSAKVMAYGYEPVEVMYDWQVYDTYEGALVSSATGVYRSDYSDEAPWTDYEEDFPFYRQIRIYPNKDQLVGLDYIDLDLYMMNLEVESISASFGGNALDVQYTNTFIGDGVLNNYAESNTAGSDKTYGVYKTVLRIDIAGVSMESGSPCIFISYVGNNRIDYLPYFYIYGINGHVDWSDDNPTLTVIQRFKNAVGGWFERLYEILGGTGSAVGEELKQGADEIQQGVDSIGQFEEQQQAVLDSNFETVTQAVSITGFSSALSFVQAYANLIFSGIGDYVIVFTVPLFLGVWFYVCSRVPGSTRWKINPPKKK